MTATRTCHGCGADVPVNAPFGQCPKCLLELGSDPAQGTAQAPASDKPEGGQVFGDYELLAQIGRGGMGTVYKARQINLNRIVALKMISAGEFASPVLIQRFHREAEAAANLSHPNIVPIYENGEINGQHYISMAAIEGMGLDEYIRRSGSDDGPAARDARSALRLRHEAIAILIAKVARAVDHAHQHGVLHRDIKPSNVIVDREGEPHLTDFGVAKVLGRGDSSLTASGAIVGTPSYMAPEQAAGQSKRITTAADVYSLGAVLYSLLTGQPPFRADTPVETLRQVVEQEPKHPSTLIEGMDVDLATIAMKCLEKEPLRRYSSASALAQELDRWTRREPIQARPIHTTERFWRWCRRNPKVATLGATVAVLLLTLTLSATIFALHIRFLNASVENNNKHLRGQVIDNLVEVYGNPGTQSYAIQSAVRRALLGQGRPPSGPGPVLSITAAVYVYEHPTNMLETFSRVLGGLEDRLSEKLQRQVDIELRMYRSYDEGYEALESNHPTFGRVGPASYLYLLDRGYGIRLLAMQDHKSPLTFALFARSNSPVSRFVNSNPGASLAEIVADRSLAMSHTNSTTGNYVAKWLFAKHGVPRSHFAKVEHLAGQSRVLDAVSDGSFELGVGNIDLVANRPDLRVLVKHELYDLGLCWVAGKGLDSALASHIEGFLLEMRDPVILEKLESEVSGFKSMDRRALDQLREIIRGAAAFDTLNK